MSDIFTMMRRLRKLPRLERIAHLRNAISVEPLRSQRRADLTSALRFEIMAQLREETRKQRKRVA